MARSFAWCLTALLVPVGLARAQTLAQLQADGTVVLDQLPSPPGPPPFWMPANAPRPDREGQVFRLRFRASDMDVCRADGAPVETRTWQEILKKPTLVRYAGHRIQAGPRQQPETPHGMGLPALEQKLFRPDLLLVFGARSPIEQGPFKDFKGEVPKGPPPVFGEASVVNGLLRVVEKSEGKAHAPVVHPTAGKDAKGPTTELWTTTTTIRTRELAANFAQIFEVDGKPVSPAALASRLGTSTPVVLSADGAPVDPFHLRQFRSGTLVVVVPLPRLHDGTSWGQPVQPKPGPPSKAPV